ncbi:MAG: glutathione S-transferase C-terminal domain-containing protein [Gammaproteobacteria bacterium]|nr:glutathione S-transferase C-terminal domain-containing protein [Gammaproteobacteria bacterium]
MLLFKGLPASPYTRKMLGLLRYRRIPYRYIQHGHGQFQDLPIPKVDLIPVFYFTDEQGELEAQVDSTFILRRLENNYKGRSVIPPPPALRFLDYLIEDYADEWMTKAMFHYRWHYAPDAKKASEVLPYWGNMTASKEYLAGKTREFHDRQIDRLYVVGSNAATAPLIEASYRRFLGCLDQHLEQFSFLMGGRPGACDFALFGQLTQLAQFDPTPETLTLETVPRVYAWVSRLEDLSGFEIVDEDWISLDPVPATLIALLKEMGRTYAPVMLANAAAVMAGESHVRTTVDGQSWEQTAFRYQARCLQWIRQEYLGLDANSAALVDSLLVDTDCECLLAVG